MRASLALLLRTSVVHSWNPPTCSELFHAEFGKIHPARRLRLLSSADVTTDAPVTVSGLQAPAFPQAMQLRAASPFGHRHPVRAVN